MADGVTVLDFIEFFSGSDESPPTEFNIRLTTGTPSAVGEANAEGTASALARADHIHATHHARSHALQSASDHTGTISATQHGTQATGDLHPIYILESLLDALGDLIYASAADTPARLAGNTTTTKKFLRQTGTGAASAIPAWETLEDGDIPAAIARDSEVTSAIGTHEAAGDPHPSYLTPAEHTVIGDSSPHHARYTDAEAIAAVPYEFYISFGADPVDGQAYSP